MPDRFIATTGDDGTQHYNPFMKPKVSIIGSGAIGGNLARLLVRAGYDVALANSRGPASLESFVAELGERLHPMEVSDLISYGDVIVVALHWRNLDDAPIFDVPGKVVIDTTNPYKVDGTFYDLKGEMASRKTQEHFPNGKLVKAFNTIWFKHLVENGNSALPVEERRVIPIAGDDADAKRLTATLIEDIGFGALDTGTLDEGSKLQEVHGVLFNNDISVREAKALIGSLGAV